MLIGLYVHPVAGASTAAALRAPDRNSLDRLLPDRNAPKFVDFKVDGLDRQALVCAPESRSAHPPLIIAFHGHGGTAGHFWRKTRFDTLWPEAVVIYPQGLKAKSKVDPEGAKNGWEYQPASNRDVDFVKAVLAWSAKTYGTQPSSSFSVGHSNGGGMVHETWATMPNAFAGFCSLAGSPVPVRYIKTPRPAFIMSGSEDPLVKPEMVSMVISYVKRIDGVEREMPKKDGAIEEYGSGSKTLWTYQWKGGHSPTAEVPGLAVKFFKSILGD